MPDIHPWVDAQRSSESYAGHMDWYDRSITWAESHRWAVDATSAAIAGALLVPGSAVAGVAGSSALGAVIGLCLVIPLAWRRTHPVISAIAVFGFALSQLLLGPTLIPADLAVAVALFSVTVYGPVWAHRTAIASAVVGSIALGLALAAETSFIDAVGTLFGITLFGSMFFLAIWAFGLVRRSRRETFEALRDRAERLEVERDQQALIATAVERARIAREMHDIVAHSLSVVVAQADGGRYAAAHDPEAATRALATISDTGRMALADMRRLLGVLRDGPNDHDTMDRLPQPDAADLQGLLDQVRESGTAVAFTQLGHERQLPPGARLVIYRVAQEALTNVLKHAGPGAQAIVTLQWRPTEVHLEVTDDGRGAATTSDGAGLGLMGMRERVDVYGGTVRAGPRPGGGFGVTMVLPVPSPASQEPA